MAAALEAELVARTAEPDALARCAVLARGGGSTRRALASAARELVAGRGWERLGFARLSDYARERLGVSGRELQDLARVDAALASLPLVSEALRTGRISWTKARLLARVATSEDEARWLGFAKALSARALAHEVRRMDVASLEAGGLGASAFDVVDDADGPRETLQLRCTPAAKAKWHRARLLASRVAGQALPAWAAAETLAAEVLSALPLEGGGPDAGAALAPVRVSSLPPRLPRAERRARASAADEEPDAFALDALLRELVACEQRAEAELAEALLAVFEARAHRERAFSTFDAYAEDELGLSPRRARMLLRLARAARRVPALGSAWRSGALSFLRAYTLVPLVLASPEHAQPWIERGGRVTCLRLEEEVSAALVLAELDPEAFASDGWLPQAAAAERSPDTRRRQGGAQVTASAETSRLVITGPRDVMRLFHATLCSVRRRLERQTGRCPTPGEAFEAMLDHACTEWWPRRTARERRAQRVYERDGWRCTAPACSSHRNLQDHHIVFRSQGGSDALANRTTLCAWHHLRGVHAGRMRCTGTAPDALRFELGLREGRRPLLVYG